MGVFLGVLFGSEKQEWLSGVGLWQLFGSCTTTKFGKPASCWLSSFPGLGITNTEFCTLAESEQLLQICSTRLRAGLWR